MLEKIDIHLVEHCNLKCRSCTHFSSLAEESFLNIDEFEKDLKRCSYLSKGEIGQIYLLGGEPLLHPDITEFFPIARNLFRNSQIIVITNGILLPEKDDSFWNALRRSGVQLWISDYQLKIPYEEMNKKAEEFGVYLAYTTATADDGKKIWAKFPLDLDGEQYYLDSFEQCAIKNCVTLKHGRLYTCPTIAHIEHFNKAFKTDLEPSEFDYVDIYKIKSWDQALSHLVKPVSFCRYCKTRCYENGEWAPTKRDIREWI